MDDNVFDQLVNFAIDVHRLQLGPRRPGDRAAIALLDRELRVKLDEQSRNDPNFILRFRTELTERTGNLDVAGQEKRQDQERRTSLELRFLQPEVLRLEAEIRKLEADVQSYEYQIKNCREQRNSATAPSSNNEALALLACAAAAKARMAHLNKRLLALTEASSP